MRLILLEAVSKPIHRCQLIGRRKVSLNHTSAACRLHGGGDVSFVVVTGGVPPVSVVSHIVSKKGEILKGNLVQQYNFYILRNKICLIFCKSLATVSVLNG